MIAARDSVTQGAVTNDHQVLASIVRRVDPSEVARAMIASFRQEIDAYHRLPDSVVAGQIFEVSKRNVELFFRWIIDGDEPTDGDLQLFRDSARNRATEGMQLEDLLQAYRAGGQIAFKVLEEAARPDEQSALLLCARMLMKYVDRVSAAVGQTYLDERQALVSEEERRLRELLDCLLDERPVPAPLRELAERIGFPLGDSYRAFALAVPGGSARRHAQIAASLRARGTLALTEGERVVGLAPPERATDTLRDSGTLLAGSEVRPLSELGEIVEELRLVADFGARLGRTGEVRPDDYLPELLLARVPRVAQMVRRRVLGPLEAYAERRTSELVETLDAFVRCGLDRRRAAAEIHVHPNTLDYRLRRIVELTGLDLRRPEDLTLVVLALRQARLAD
jgi:hypothetical protein